MPDDAPLIVTLELDADSFAFLDGLRRRHFPPERNVLPAHLTLFHKLPGEEIETVCAILALIASRTPPLPLDVAGLRFLGYGSAFEIVSPALIRLRAGLADAFEPWLTPQDRQRFQPHVTIQNKAPVAEAKRLFQTLTEDFQPMTATGTGLALWHYRDGPWEAAGRSPFEGAA